MTSWQGPDHPVPDEIVWTERGIKIRNAVRWVTGTIVFAALVAAMTHRYGIS